jgi:hypothetical protein
VFQWTWLWRVAPLDGGARTRLVVRFLIQLPTTGDNPVLTGVMTAGGFVMQQRMLHGLRLRAEGGAEPPYIEGVEIALWLLTLAAGLAAGLVYLLQPEWRRPLAVAVVAVVVLVALTFVQPALWVRALANAALLAGVWWSRQRAARPALSFQSRRALT